MHATHDQRQQNEDKANLQTLNTSKRDERVDNQCTFRNIVRKGRERKEKRRTVKERNEALEYIYIFSFKYKNLQFVSHLTIPF